MKKGKTGTSMTVIRVPKRPPGKRASERAASVKAGLIQYCPCGGKLIRMNTPGVGWFWTCTKWCGYEVPAPAP